MTSQAISIEMLKTALVELARTDREFFVNLWADVLGKSAPKIAPNRIRKTKANGTQPKKKRRTKEEQQFVEGLKQALNEVELHQQGKIKLPTFQEMMAEL